MFEQLFPISDYYKKNIIDAVTITRAGIWWSAILLIEDPKSKKQFLSLYKWQYKELEWRIRSRFKITKKKDADKIVKIINDFSEKLV